MELVFETPVRFSFEVVEKDDHLPSMKGKVRLVVEQFQSRLCYEACLWFECSVWDDFLRSMHNICHEKSCLHDMDDKFNLFLFMREKQLFLGCCAFKEDVGGERHVRFDFESRINEDQWGGIRDKFDDFLTWW
jgi:hypothetical protein